MTSPIDAAFIGFPGGQGDPNMAPSPHLAAAAPATAAAADTAATDLEGTDTANAAKIGDVPEQDGTQVATIIPGLLGAAAGAVGGALGSAVSALERIPQSMMGALGPAMSALTAAGGVSDPVVVGDITAAPTGYTPGISAGGGPGAVGATTTASGPLPSAVLPVTGASPTRPVIPPGATTTQQTPSAGGGGFAPMPMGMPMGGAGAAGAAGAPEGRSKKVSTPRRPHTEPVAGKIAEERIAVPAKPRDDKPTVRRVTIPEAKE